MGRWVLGFCKPVKFKMCSSFANRIHLNLILPSTWQLGYTLRKNWFNYLVQKSWDNLTWRGQWTAIIPDRENSGLNHGEKREWESLLNVSASRFENVLSGFDEWPDCVVSRATGNLQIARVSCRKFHWKMTMFSRYKGTPERWVRPHTLRLRWNFRTSSWRKRDETLRRTAGHSQCARTSNENVNYGRCKLRPSMGLRWFPADHQRQKLTKSPLHVRHSSQSL